ncbi:hypothetical protein [Bacillus badius]|nr:hypothetical protein [Bacillus badius]MED4718211.1 hypothetical protein [Bacillus badius]
MVSRQRGEFALYETVAGKAHISKEYTYNLLYVGEGDGIVPMKL